jgi:hypothetical protein
MPIKISEIVLNVTVAVGPPAEDSNDGSTSGQTGGAGTSPQAGQTDPNAIADRVYRLIRDDLERGWERE